MKKLLVILLAFCFVMPVMAQNKALEKARKKEYKTKMKEFADNNWKIYGSSRSLDVALLSHYAKLDAAGQETYEIQGACSRFKSKNIGHQTCLNNAAITYAQLAGKKLKGRVVSDMAGDTGNLDAEFDRFYAAYEALVEKEVQGELQESFSIIRELEPGVFEMQTFFVISEDSASKARIRAYENAMKESTAAQKYASKVGDFIKEGFDPAAGE